MKDKKTYLTPNEAAKYLGVCRNTIYNYLQLEENPLKGIHLSSRIIRINKEELNKWIKSYNLLDDGSIERR